jgi:hypothetical protein
MYKRDSRIVKHELPVMIHLALQNCPNSLQQSRECRLCEAYSSWYDVDVPALTRFSGDPSDLADNCGDHVTFGTTFPVAHEMHDPTHQPQHHVRRIMDHPET